MIGLLSKVVIIDNSGGLIGRCIKVLKNGVNHPLGNIGDIIIVSVIKTSSGSLIQKGDIHKALIVRTAKINNNVKWTINVKLTKTEIQVRPKILKNFTDLIWLKKIKRFGE